MEDKNTAREKNNSLVKSAIYFATGTFSSRLLGLVRDSLLFATFDKTVLDAFNAALRFPNLFRRIFGEGALSACFIPLYVEYRRGEDKKSLSQLTVGILTLLLIILIPLNVAVIASMDWLIPLWVSGDGFSQVPGKLELTIQMTKIMFPFLLLISLYAFLMAVLNAHKQFVMSAVAPSLYNLTLITVNVYCYYQRELDGYLLAWSVIAAGFVQFAILIPPYLKLNNGYDFKWSHLASTPVRRTLKAFGPTVLGLGIVQIMGLINMSFASQLKEGSVSYISAADRLLELPLSLVAVSLGTVLLPSLSEIIGRKAFDEFNSTVSKMLKVVIYLCVPAAVGMWMVAPLLVSVLFERGRFVAGDTVVVASIVQIYCFTLMAASLSRILSQAFYAHKNTFQPAMASLAGLILHLILAPQLMARFGIYGLAGSTSIAAFSNVIYLFSVYRIKFGSIRLGDLAWFFTRSLSAASAIVGVCWLVNQYMPSGVFGERLVALTVAVILSVAGYFVLSIALRLDEAQTILQKFKRKLKL